MALDPFSRFPVTGRLWMAVVLCIVPLGLVWSRVDGYLTSGIIGPMSCDPDGYCTPGTYTPGIYVAGQTTLVSQSPARVFLLAAAAALVVTAARVRSHATRRIARLATGALVVAAVLSLANRATVTLACVLLALALVAPPAYRDRARAEVRGPFGPDPSRG